MEKIIFEIPKEDIEEMVDLIRFSLANKAVSNDVWTLLMNFCEEHGEKISPEKMLKYKK